MHDFEDTLHLVPKVASNDQYRAALPVMREFMTRSRQARNDPRSLLDLQRDMAVQMIGLQNNRRSIRDEGSGSGEAVESLICRKLIQILRTIGDGIAWRTLRYDRAVIYQLALKAQTGALDLRSTMDEFAVAHGGAYKDNNLTIVNGVTNALRYGDCTSIDRDGHVKIAEVKSGKGSKKSGKAKKQRRNLKRKTDFINTGFGVTQAGPSHIFVHQCELRSHLSGVRELIENARKGLAAHARLSNCLAVEVLSREWQEEKKLIVNNPFQHSNSAFTYSSLDYFFRYPRNVAPYSVFPFSADDCTDLMTGDLVLLSHFNHRNLVRSFRRRNLVVEVPTNEQFESFMNLPPGERNLRQEEISMKVSRRSDLVELTVHQALLARHLYEFLDEESFVDAAIEALDSPDRATLGRALYPKYAEESLLWD